MDKTRITVGWQEWVSFPDLNLPWLQAKIDSGKKTSILHTFVTEPFEKAGQAMVRFGVHPHQNDRDTATLCEAPVTEKREGHNADGEPETHYLIKTTLQMGNDQWPIKLLLINRDEMKFRLSLGHTAIDGRLLVDPSESFLLGKPPEQEQVKEKP